MQFFKLSLLMATSLVLTSTFFKNEVRASNDEPSAEEMKMREITKKASPEELVKLLNSGWTDDYNQAKKALNPEKSYIVLHAWDPGSVMDLRTADGFRASLHNLGLLNIEKVEIGHTWVAWRCQTASGIVEGAAAQTGEHSKQVATMLKGGWGLAAFKSNFVDGFLQYPKLLKKAELEEGVETLHSLFVEVDDSVCAKAMSFVEEYAHHPKNPRVNFGLEPDPKKFEGGGCGSFGVSVAQVAGLFGSEKIADSFWRKVKAKSSLFGFGLQPTVFTKPYVLPGATGVRKVPLMVGFNPFGGSVLFSSWNGTAANDPTLNIMDPELLVLFMRKIYHMKYGELRSSDPEFGKKFFNSNAKNLYSYRKFSQEGGAFEEGLEQKKWRISKGGIPNQVIVDKTYDPQAERVFNSTERWVSSNKFRAKFVKFGKDGRAVILSKSK